jgi:hypothetical protein
VSQQETHWTRILHQDLFEPTTRAHFAPAAVRHEENRLSTRDTASRNTDPARSPLGSAMILLGIYIAMYLAVAEIVHVLAPSQAATMPLRDDTHVAASAAMPSDTPDTGARHATTD